MIDPVVGMYVMYALISIFGAMVRLLLSQRCRLASMCYDGYGARHRGLCTPYAARRLAVERNEDSPQLYRTPSQPIPTFPARCSYLLADDVKCSLTGCAAPGFAHRERVRVSSEVCIDCAAMRYG